MSRTPLLSVSAASKQAGLPAPRKRYPRRFTGSVISTTPFPSTSPRRKVGPPPDVFFSSRRRHTIWPRDWSSDECSSDLSQPHDVQVRVLLAREGGRRQVLRRRAESEERRVGKECRSRWSPYH